MYTSTCHQPMRTGVVIPRQRLGEDGEPEPRPLGHLPRQRPGRQTARLRAIAESAGIR